jgi:hypothetical protein
METLRRAAIYASANPKLSDALLARLDARAKTGGALAVFDYGYEVETLRQTELAFKGGIPALGKTDGYRLVLKAMEQHPDPAMEFAAAVITADKSKADHAAHLQRAAAGAKTDAVLAENLRTHIAAR